MPDDLIPADMQAQLQLLQKVLLKIGLEHPHRLEAQPPPATIYHYTDDNGLLGIVKNGTLWLGNYILRSLHGAIGGFFGPIKITVSSGFNIYPYVWKPPGKSSVENSICASTNALRIARVVGVSRPRIRTPQYSAQGYVRVCASKFQFFNWIKTPPICAARYKHSISFGGYANTTECGTSSGTLDSAFLSALSSFCGSIRHAVSFSISAVLARSSAVSFSRVAIILPLMLLALTCITSSAMSATTSNNAEALLPLVRHQVNDLNQSKKSWITSPATPIATAATDTYPAISQSDKDAVTH